MIVTLRTNVQSVSYQASLPTTGWQDAVVDGALAGTTGQVKRLEAIQVSIIKPDSKESTRIGSINNNGGSISYTYDKVGNIDTITENEKVIKYYYNELNELTREDNQILNKTITYSYDAGGNITNKVEYPYTTGALGTATKTTAYSYGDTNWKDKLTSFDGKSITYDQIGNTLTYNGFTYTWEMGRQLKSVSGNNLNIEYKYNDAGVRTEKTVNGVTTKYHLVGDKITYEDNGTDKIYYTYDSSDNLVSMNLNGVEYYYIRNAQNDIIGLFDNTGTQVVSYTYDSWGMIISTTGTLSSTVGAKNPYRYRGYRCDSETQLYYLQSRYYNPEWGRFINADELVGETGDLLGHNMFLYCKNNPINMKDPSGCWPTWTDILDAGKKLVNSVVEAIEETVIKATFMITSMVIFVAKNPDIAQAIIIPSAIRGLNKSSKSFSKTFPSQKAARKAAFRDAGIGKHGKSTPIVDIKRNPGSRHPYQGTEQIRQGWVGEKRHEVFHDIWGHKEDPFDMPHFNVYFKDGRKGHYYYPSSWDPKNNR